MGQSCGCAARYTVQALHRLKGKSRLTTHLGGKCRGGCCCQLFLSLSTNSAPQAACNKLSKDASLLQMLGYMATVAKLLVKSKEMGLSLQESEAVGVKTALRRAIYS